MHRSTMVLLLTVLTVLFGGCGSVSESDHQMVTSELNALKSELTSLQEGVASLAKEYASLKHENKSLRNELQKQRKEITRLVAREAAKPIEDEETASEETPRAYKAKSGDTLWSIARRFRVSVATLQKLNDLQDSNIKAGQQILLH